MRDSSEGLAHLHSSFAVLALIAVAALFCPAFGGVALVASPSKTAKPPSVRDYDIFWSRRGYKKGGRSYHQIWRMRADGSGARQITFGKRDHLRPMVSPDGKRLAYFTRDDGSLWIARPNGTQARQFAHTGMAWNLERIRWSADSREIIGSSDSDDSALALSFSTGKARKIVVSAPWKNDRISPDGRWEASCDTEYAGLRRRLYLTNLKSKERTMLLEDVILRVRWVPTSNTLLVITDKNDPNRSLDPQLILHRIDVKSKKDTKVEGIPGKISSMWEDFWSPDARYFTMHFSIYGAHDGGDTSFYDMQERKWIHVGEGEKPCWSPDSRHLVYRTNLDVTALFGKQLWVTHIRVFDASSGRNRQLTFGGSMNDDPSWGSAN